LALADAGDAKASATMRIGASEVCVGGHPVGGIGESLLGGQNGQERGKRIKRERLSERKVLAGKLKPVAGAMIANHRTIGGNNFNAQIVKRESVSGHSFSRARKPP